MSFGGAHGDVVRAFAALAPENDHTRRTIARMLGLSPAPSRVESDDVEQPVPLIKTEVVHHELQSSLQLAIAERHEEHLPSTCTKVVSGADVRRPAWAESITPLRRQENATPSAELPVDPLFSKRTVRATLTSALSVLRDSGTIDLEKLVRRFAECKPILIVPRKPRATLARGVQVLMDVGDSMVLFRSDQLALLEDLRHVVGRGAVEVLLFSGALRRGVWPLDQDAVAVSPETLPPQHGAAVLLLSDLGIARAPSGQAPVTPSEWARTAGELVRRGSPVVAFVPYGKQRWPKELRSRIALVLWDCSTTPRSVRASIGRGLSARTR